MITGEDYKRCNSYNVDETGLFFGALSPKTMGYYGEKRLEEREINTISNMAGNKGRKVKHFDVSLLLSITIYK